VADERRSISADDGDAAAGPIPVLPGRPDNTRALGVALVISGLMMAAGACFAWFAVSVPFGQVASLKGIDSGGSDNIWWHNIAPGWLAILGGLLLLIVGLVATRTPSGTGRRAAVLLGVGAPLIVGLVSLLDYHHANDSFNEFVAQHASSDPDYHALSAGIGTGLFVTLAGCALALVAVLVLQMTNRLDSSPDSPPSKPTPPPDPPRATTP
jgi:hypothetical protein